MHRHGFAEFTNVRAAAKHTIGTGDDNGMESNISARQRQRGGNTLPGSETHAIDRRVINRDEGDIVLDLVASGHWVFLMRV